MCLAVVLRLMEIISSARTIEKARRKEREKEEHNAVSHRSVPISYICLPFLIDARLSESSHAQEEEDGGHAAGPPFKYQEDGGILDCSNSK